MNTDIRPGVFKILGIQKIKNEVEKVYLKINKTQLLEWSLFISGISLNFILLKKENLPSQMTDKSGNSTSHVKVDLEK